MVQYLLLFKKIGSSASLEEEFFYLFIIISYINLFHNNNNIIYNNKQHSREEKKKGRRKGEERRRRRRCGGVVVLTIIILLLPDAELYQDHLQDNQTCISPRVGTLTLNFPNQRTRWLWGNVYARQKDSVKDSPMAKPPINRGQSICAMLKGTVL